MNAHFRHLQPIFSDRRFLVFWSGQWTSQVGDRAYQVALAVFVYALTGSASEVGKVIAITFLPSMLLGPLAGVYVDRWDRKKTMIVADFSRAALVLLMLLVTSVKLVYVITFVLSAFGNFFFPAYAAAIPSLVPKEKLQTVNSLMIGTRRFALVLGPLIGGFLVGFAGVKVAFLINSLSFMISAITVSVTRFPRHTSMPTNSARSVRESLRAGLRHILRSPLVFGIFALVAVNGLVIGANNALVIVFTTRVLHLAAAGYGLLLSALGIGMILGSVALAVYGSKLPRVRLLQASVFTIGLAYTVFASVAFLPINLLMRATHGLGLAIFNTSVFTGLQEDTDDSLHGRIFAMYRTLEDLCIVAGAAAAGWLADWFGVQMVLVAVGLIMLLAAGIPSAMLLRSPSSEPPRVGRALPDDSQG